MKVSSNKLDTFLKNMGIDLKEKEIQELKDCLPVDGESFEYYIPLSKTMDMRLVSGLEWLKVGYMKRKKKSRAFTTATKLNPMANT